MAAGIGGLLAMPATLQEPKPLFVRARDSTPPPCNSQTCCNSQTWPMVERRCQAWTTPRAGDEARFVRMERSPQAFIQPSVTPQAIQPPVTPPAPVPDLPPKALPSA